MFCVLPLLLVFILDLPKFYRDLCRALYNITGDEKYKPKKNTKKPKLKKTEVPKESTHVMQDAVTMQDDVTIDDPGEGTSGLQDAITMPASDGIGSRINKRDSVNRRKKVVARRKMENR